MPVSSRPAKSKSAAPSDADLSSQRHDALLVEFGTPEVLTRVFQAEYDMIDALGSWSFTTKPLVPVPGRTVNQVIGYIDREVLAQRVVVCQHCLYLRDNVLIHKSWADDPRREGYPHEHSSFEYLAVLLKEADEELNLDHENASTINNDAEGVPSLDDLVVDEIPDDVHLPRCSTHVPPWRLRREWQTYLQKLSEYKQWHAAYTQYQQGNGPLPSEPQGLRKKPHVRLHQHDTRDVPPEYYRPTPPAEPCPPRVNAEEIASCEFCQIHRSRSCPTHGTQVVKSEADKVVYQQVLRARAGFLLWGTPPSVGEMLREIRTYQAVRQDIDLWVVVVDTPCPHREILQDADIAIVERDGASWIMVDREVTWEQMQVDRVI